MSLCKKCGNEIQEGARFCPNCGEAVTTDSSQNSNRKTVFEGALHKCPSCGETLPSLVIKCPTCGYEIRGSSATGSVQQLYSELNRATSIKQKAFVIRNYPIPNAKEDIIEFMILAASNISGETDQEIFAAWTSKFKQAYQKAQMTLQNDSAFSQIKEIYERTEKNIAVEKITHTTTTAKNLVTQYFKFMPNPVFAIVVAALAIFNIVSLISGRFAGGDIIFDVIVLKVAYNITDKHSKNSKLKRSGDSSGTSLSDIYEVKIPSAVLNHESENYAVIESHFLQAGFTNVRTIPLNDLTFGVRKKVGSVDTITIDGKNLSSYFRRTFDSNVPVLITYHSLRN